MDSNYYNQDRFQNELNEALNYVYPDENDCEVDEQELRGYLSKEELEELIKKLVKPPFEEYIELENGDKFTSCKFLGWSKFSRDYLSIHISLDDEVYLRTVLKIKSLKRFLDILIKNRFNVIYSGIKTNSRGQEYPSLHLEFY